MSGSTTCRALVAGLGTSLPTRVVTNDELSASLDTTDEWIRTRTGIRQRHWVGTGTSTGDLAVSAGARALRSAGLARVDLVVVGTTTPDHPCPATAPEVATRLRLGPVAAFDLAAVCSGFVYALAMAASAIRAGTFGSALVIGAEAYSTILDPRDRATSVIFGDGAGAVVLRAGDADEPGALLGFDLGSDGRFRELITIPAGGARQRTTEGEPTEADFYFAMHGKDVFAHAVTRMTESSRALLARLGWPVGSVDRVVAHQANVRILYGVARQLHRARGGQPRPRGQHLRGLGSPRPRARRGDRRDRAGRPAAADRVRRGFRMGLDRTGVA
jgi:3-oxoacyl-[acyl-carrier-protein] synthase-3